MRNVSMKAFLAGHAMDPAWEDLRLNELKLESVATASGQMRSPSVAVVHRTGCVALALSAPVAPVISPAGQFNRL